MFGEWKVQIVTLPGYMLKRIYMIRRNLKTTEYLTHLGTIVTFDEQTYPKNADDIYFAEMDEQQLQSLANELANQGVRTTNDSKNEGLLEATKNHLEDMRTLVFKRSK